MNFEVTDYRTIPDSDCLEDVIAVSKKMGKRRITLYDYFKHGKYSGTTIRKKFGTWNKALERAGLEISRWQWQWKTGANKEEDIFNNLTSVWLRLNRQPKLREMIYPLSLYSASVRRVGCCCVAGAGCDKALPHRISTNK